MIGNSGEEEMNRRRGGKHGGDGDGEGEKRGGGLEMEEKKRGKRVEKR